MRQGADASGVPVLFAIVSLGHNDPRQVRRPIQLIMRCHGVRDLRRVAGVAV